MAQTIEDVNSRTLLQQFHELYNKQNETETDVENLDAKIDQETLERQTSDLSLNSEIQALKDQIDSLGVLFTFKGEVATIQDLPVTDNKPGDVYYVDSEQSGYIWLEKSGVYQWEEFGPAIDLSEYAKQEDLEQLEDQVTAMGTQVGNNTTFIENLTNTKQDKLTAGTNITIDANNVISASGGQECLIGTTDPTTATVGEVGQFYLNTTTNKLFQCQSAGGGSYTWGVPSNFLSTAQRRETFDGIKWFYFGFDKQMTFAYDVTTRVAITPSSPDISIYKNGNALTLDYYHIQHTTGSGTHTDNFYFPSKSGTFALLENITANAFSTSTNYVVGDLTVYQNKLYKCTIAHTGAWNANDFVEVTIQDLLNEKANTSDIDAKVPDAPNTDGTYTLKCVVSNGGTTKTYQWVLDS